MKCCRQIRVCLATLCVAVTCSAFSNPALVTQRMGDPAAQFSRDCFRLEEKSAQADGESAAGDNAMLSPLFNFADPQANATVKFERIDDAIMGGISLSSLRQSPNEGFARWSGVCRTDGGGFCGTRTLPFNEPLKVGGADGLYLVCRLASDQDFDRRVWKVTSRSEQARGELLYQAAYQMPGAAAADEDSWHEVRIPFSNFQLVKGPRLVKGGPPLNTTGGIYQIGLSLSKFQISEDTDELDNFRPGFFEVHFKEIGLYKASAASAFQVESPLTLSKEESLKKRPMALKLLFPIVKLFFNEQSQRRKSAMRLLRSRGLSRLGAIKFGIVSRAHSKGVLLSCMQASGIVLRDLAITIMSYSLRLAIVYPLTALRKTGQAISALFKGSDDLTKNGVTQ